MKSARADSQILSLKDTTTRASAISWAKSHRTAWQRYDPHASFASRSIRHSPYGFRPSPRLAPDGMAGRCKVRVMNCDPRSLGVSRSTFEIQHSSFSPSSNQSGEGTIRRALIEADRVDCMVALPGQLFYSTQIPICLWFIRGNRKAGSTAFGLN